MDSRARKLIKGIVLSVISMVLAQTLTFAQVSVSSLLKTYSTDVKLTLKDADTGETVCFASVYLTQPNDSTITHFTLSDGKGVATLTKVPQQDFILYAEMVGYEPYAKKIKVTLPSWPDHILDLGEIKMKQSAEMLSAAKVSAAAAPMVIKQDTVVYNAAAYKVADDAKLGDLLSKMPGMEVKNGGVTVNGEQVKNITIGGRTFFLNDPSVALSNIPAKIVENVKVFEEATDEAKFSGIVSKNDKQTVMDVGLKPEFQDGFFGNAEIAGGWEDEFLSKSSLFASAYSPKDMLSIVANATNVEDPMDPSLIMFRAGNVDNSYLSGRDGVKESAMVGANLNTSRIKKFNTDASAKYNFNRLSVADTVKQESFTQEEDISTSELLEGTTKTHQINARVTLNKKNVRKLMLRITAHGDFSEGEESSSNIGSTISSAGSNSESVRLSGGENKTINGGINAITRYNFAQKRRALMASATVSGSHSKGNGYDNVLIDYGTDSYRQDLVYDKNTSASSFVSRISYEEPLADKWLLQAVVIGNHFANKVDKDASSEYYSTHSSTWRSIVTQTATVQYKNSKHTVIAGVSVDESQNKTWTEKYGTRGGDWQTNFAPRVQYNYTFGKGSFMLNYSGRTSQPSNAQMNPGLDFSDPTQAVIGNAGLRSSFTQSLSSIIRYNDRARQRSVSAHASINTTSNQISQAVWYDTKGLRFSVPVNLNAPSLGYSCYITASMPLDRAQHFTLSLSPSVDYSISRSLQPRGRLDVIDTGSFDYDDFLEWFNTSDDFLRSRTNSFGLYLSGGIKYSVERVSVMVGARAGNHRTRYSINRDADINTWDDRLSASVVYSAPKEIEFSSNMEYLFYKGYMRGMGEPEFLWNARIAKKLKYCSVSLKAIDLLDQQRRLSKNFTSSTVREVYSNIRGRMFLLGVSFDFGKLNAAKNAKAQDVYRNMMF